MRTQPKQTGTRMKSTTGKHENSKGWCIYPGAATIYPVHAERSATPTDTSEPTTPKFLAVAGRATTVEEQAAYDWGWEEAVEAVRLAALGAAPEHVDWCRKSEMYDEHLESSQWHRGAADYPEKADPPCPACVWYADALEMAEFDVEASL